MAGIDFDKAREIKEIERFRSVYVPDNSITWDGRHRRYSDYLCENILTIKRNACKEHFPIYDKVYFSRTAINDGREYGEKSIERLFKEHGFVIIHPENLSLENQIWILSHCQTFASTEGSISHGAIFCKEGANIIILRKANYINAYQTMIDSMINAKVTYIDVNHSLIHGEAWAGPFYLCVTNYLARYFGKHKLDFYFLHISWYKYVVHYLKARTRLSKLFK